MTINIVGCSMYVYWSLRSLLGTSSASVNFNVYFFDNSIVIMGWEDLNTGDHGHTRSWQ